MVQVTGQDGIPIPIGSQRAALRRGENKLQMQTCSDEPLQLRSELLRAERMVAEMSADLNSERAAKFQELAMVVHGLRNPAGSILSALEYVVEDALGFLTDEQTALLRGAAQSAMVMLRIVDNILEFSKFECGGSTAHFTCSDLVSITKDVITLNRLRADRRQIEVRTHFETPTLMIDCDTPKIIQLIDNLICNAIKFSEPGHKIEVRSGANESYAFLSILDEGPGIPPERLRTLFEPFQRGQNGHEFYDAGGGLGLAISKRIVDLHCGTIEVRNRVANGSEFTINLPLRSKAVADTVCSHAKRFEQAAG